MGHDDTRYDCHIRRAGAWYYVTVPERCHSELPPSSESNYATVDWGREPAWREQPYASLAIARKAAERMYSRK